MVVLDHVNNNYNETGRRNNNTVLMTTTKYIISDVNFDGSAELIPMISHTSSHTHTVNELGKQLLEAAKEGNVDNIRWLLSKGATFTADWLGTSPLHLAAQNNHIETCELLLRGGISKDVRTKVDRTPLHMASYEGHLEIVEILLEHGSDYDAKDLLGMTPLHWAAQNGHIKVAAALIRHGSSTDVTNKFDLTPMDIAMQINRHDIAEMIIMGIRDPTMATQSLEVQLAADNLNNEEEEQDDSNGEICMESFVEDDNSNNASIPLETVLMEDDNTLEQNSLQETLEEQQQQDNSSNNANLSEELQEEEEEESITTENLNNENTFTEQFKLLQEHGITMLPNDDTNNILTSVMESGHSVVLTDVGREVLNSMKELDDDKTPLIKTPEKHRVITLSPDEFIALTNGTLQRADLLKQLNGKFAPKTVRRIVMKKNKIIPVSTLTSAVQNQGSIFGKGSNSDMETVMTQLIEARKTIEDLKTKLLKKEQEVERYKTQLKLFMDNPS